MSASHSTDPKLAEALAECERLREENRQLRQRFGLSPIEAENPLLNGIATSGSIAATVTSKSTPDDKVKLFRNLFRGREDVYAVRWEGRNGKVGYSPAYHRIWWHVIPPRPRQTQGMLPVDRPGHSRPSDGQTYGRRLPIVGRRNMLVTRR